MASNSKVNKEKVVVEGEVVEEKVKKEFIPQKNENKPKKNFDPSKYSNGIFLIFLGVFLLLNTLGVVPLSAWFSVVKFWPLLIIFAGLNLMFGKNRFMQWALLLISAFAWFVILIFVLFQHSQLPFFTENNTLDKFNDILVQLEDDTIITDSLMISKSEYTEIDEIRMTIDQAIGKFSLNDSALIDNFIEIDSTHGKNSGHLSIETEQISSVLNVDLKQKNRSGVLFGIPKDVDNKIRLDREIPIKLETIIAAGEGNIEIREQKLLELDANVAAGDLELLLGSESVNGSKLVFGVGAGRVVLDLPADVGYKVYYDIGAGSLSLEDLEINGLGKSGLYRSSNNDDAEYRVDIVVNIGAGEFIIK